MAKPVKDYLMFIEAFIDQFSWAFAKTMPNIPYYYVVRGDLSVDKRKVFDEFDGYIKQRGYKKLFYGKCYNYLNIGNYKYWIIEDILNRAKL